MPPSDKVALDGTPWALAVDEEAGELHIEHDESGDSYVFDEEGNLRVPGDGDVDGPLHEVRDALAAALAEGDDEPQTSDGTCTVACDEETGELRLASEEGITLDAPVIDVNAGEDLNATAGSVDLETTDVTFTGTQQTTVRSRSKLTIESPVIEASTRGLMRLSATGPMTIEGALINLN